MDNETKTTATEGHLTAEPAPLAVKPVPATVPERLDEVVRQVKAELVSGHERRRGSNPYDSELGRPSRDVWGNRKRA